MAKWTEVAQYQVLDLSDPGKAAFVKPGFYWTIPPTPENDAADPDRKIALIGPFTTHEQARDDAIAWIHQTLSQAA